MIDDTTIEKADISSEIARITFSIFAYIADIAKNVTAHEVRRLQFLLRDTAWVENDDLRVALVALKKDYSTFWTDYEEQAFAVNGNTIVAALERLQQELGEERSWKLRIGMSKFIEQFDYSSFGTRLTKHDQEVRARARRELQSILKPSGQELIDGGAHDGLKSAGCGSLTAASGAPADSKAANIFWGGGRTTVRCISVTTETHDTKTYNFVSKPQRLFHYKPGQFVTIELAVQGELLRRCYSISSSPSRPYTLSITVKKTPMGKMSNWLFDNMVEGLECVIDGPMGKFTCVGQPADKLLFVVAGSGVTPAMSMLRWLADTASKADIVFINNVRTPDDIVFYQELLHLSTRLGDSVRLAIVPVQRSGGHPWNGSIGKFNEALLRFYAPDFAEREVYACGPAGYTAAVKSLLSARGFPMHRYHDESFGGAPATVISQRPEPETISTAPKPQLAAATRPQVSGGGATSTSPFPISQPATISHSPKPAPAGAATKNAKIFLEGRSESFPARQGQTILEAAEAAGVTLENSCRSGVCGACKVRKTRGQVEMTPGSALSEADIKNGYVLTCVGRAVGEISLQC